MQASHWKLLYCTRTNCELMYNAILPRHVNNALQTFQKYFHLNAINLNGLLKITSL
uniref:Uncharacterized protein n=2 Tax=Timema TaxID=61471 RepID=A0A7R9P0I8_9NEOP|nr:unnamed protein product [Timema bartmani]CAD7463227.1 unnamed protein product [Timema tahoe]